MDFVGKYFDANINSAFQAFGAKDLNVCEVSNIFLFSLKVIILLLCKV